jgi:Fe-S cluster assembly protein SufD
LPDRRDENWKYLDHARIGEYALEAAPALGSAAPDLSGRLLPLPDARRIVLVDGRLAPSLSNDNPAAGLEVIDIAELLEREPQKALSMLRAPGHDADDRYALLADAFAAGGVLVRVAPGRELAQPVYLVHLATAARPALHQSRVVVEAGKGARFALVEHFVAGGDAAALGNLAAEISLDEGSELTHLRLHQHAATAAQIETWVVRAAARSRYRQHLLALGGRLLRSNLRVALEGAGAACQLDGLFLADGERQVDLVTQVAHLGEATQTAQECRGIAAGRLLSPLAEINARPQLEIGVDEVECRHGATTGTLDADHLFYLRSRGLDEASARALLTFAFCRDLVARIPLEEVRAAAEALVAGALPDRDLIEGLA